MRLSCLHTAPWTIGAYEAARSDGIDLTHHVRSDLLYRAGSQGDMGLGAELNAYLSRMQAGSDAVVMTCTLLAPLVEPPAQSGLGLFAAEVGPQLTGRRVAVLYTRTQSRPALAASLGTLPQPASVTLTEVEAALDYLREGDMRTHDRLMRTAIAKALAAVDIVLLPQPTAGFVAPEDPRVLTAPAAVMAHFRRRAAAGIDPA